jgi:ABC-type transport system involved in multi-copper enzyme maturation permease subunit
MNLLKSEFRKLVYARSTYGLLLASILLASLSAGVSPYVLSRVKMMGIGGLSQSNIVDTVYGKAASAYLFAIILGVLMMAGEFRQGTAVATFLAAPKRSRVFLAKVSVAAIAGALFQLISAGIGMTTATIALSFYPEAAAPGDTAILDTTLAALISGAVLAVVGVGVGALLRSQIIGIVSVMVWLNVIEPIMLLVFPDGAKWWATGAISGMLNLHVKATRIGLNTEHYLEPWQASLLLLGYGAAVAAIALVTTMRRDVD